MIRLVRLADLGRRNVDLDQCLAVEQVVPKTEGRVLVEGVADRDHDVRLTERLPGTCVPTLREDSDSKRVAFRDHALAVQGGEQRELEPVDKSLEGRLCVTADRAETRQDDDATAGLECFRERGGDRVD